MKWPIFFLLIALGLPGLAQSDSRNPHGLPIICDFKAYKAAVANNADNELVEIKKAIPSIVLDIRYATKKNFMQQVMYRQAKAFARKPVVDQLKKIQSALKPYGYGLQGRCCRFPRLHSFSSR